MMPALGSNTTMMPAGLASRAGGAAPMPNSNSSVPAGSTSDRDLADGGFSGAEVPLIGWMRRPGVCV